MLGGVSAVLRLATEVLVALGVPRITCSDAVDIGEDTMSGAESVARITCSGAVETGDEAINDVESTSVETVVVKQACCNPDGTGTEGMLTAGPPEPTAPRFVHCWLEIPESTADSSLDIGI